MPQLDDFSRALLARLGAPSSSSDLAMLSGWYAIEATHAAFNPLATTLPMPGASDFNSTGVKNYPDFTTGVEASARTLLGGYPRIVADLRAGDGIAAGSESAELLKWSNGGYDHVPPGTGGGGLPGDGGGHGGGGMASITDTIGGWLLDAVGFIGLGFGGGQAAAAGNLRELQQDSLHANQRVALTPGELAAAVVKGHADPAYAQDQAAYSGLAPDKFAMLVETTGNPPGPQELLTLWRRGQIAAADVARGLREGYLRNDWIPQILNLKPEILTPFQAVESAVQGQMSYDEAARVAEQSGVMPGDFDIMYRTAGNPPGPTELLTLWQRGDIDQGRLEQGLRESRLKNAWIADFLKLAVRKIPLRTITTLLNNGAISDDVAMSKLRQLGYSADDAAALIAGHKAPPKEPHRELSVGVVRDLYADHVISRDMAQGDLVKLGYAGPDASQLLDYVDTITNRKLRAATVNRIRSMYVGRRIDKAKATTELDTLNVPADQRDQMLLLWDIEVDASPHTLAPTDVCAAGRLGLFPPNEVIGRLVELGFSQQDAVTYAIVHKGIAKPASGG